MTMGYMGYERTTKSMTNKIGRNDPCPCGSGKKYKQCCAQADAGHDQQERKGHDGAIGRALDWLTTKHKKAFGVAMRGILFDGLGEREGQALERLDAKTWEAIQINATEALLAEGEILVKGERKRVSECLLGRGGPLFTVDQRHWIAQLAERPLRLYSVTEVIPAQQMTVCDVLDAEAPPVIVREKSGSQAFMLGVQVGLRVMAVDDYYELSGATYSFSGFAGPDVSARLRAAWEAFDGPPADLPHVLSSIIRHQWLEQFYAPPPMPTMMDAYSGEALLMITDHYRVKDWAALTQALSTQGDVHGDRESGWSRLIECQDGANRVAAAINIGGRANKVRVFYRTQGYADAGRPWFEALAHDAVEFVSRELSDPKGAMAHNTSVKGAKGAKAKADAPDIPPEVVADLVKQAIHRLYANWADEPIPALGGKTPREAIKTPSGLERVKGLLREYEANEKAQAAQQGRFDTSFAFLWNVLGIVP